jgi:hypothetical protein
MSISLRTMKAKKMENTVLFGTEEAAEKEIKVALPWLYARPKFLWFLLFLFLLGLI